MLTLLMCLKAEGCHSNIHYKFGGKNLMSIIVLLFVVPKDACNDKAVTSGNQTYGCVTFWLEMTLWIRSWS